MNLLYLLTWMVLRRLGLFLGLLMVLLFLVLGWMDFLQRMSLSFFLQMLFLLLLYLIVLCLLEDIMERCFHLLLMFHLLFLLHLFFHLLFGFVGLFVYLCFLYLECFFLLVGFLYFDLLNLVVDFFRLFLFLYFGSVLLFDWFCFSVVVSSLFSKFLVISSRLNSLSLNIAFLSIVFTLNSI